MARDADVRFSKIRRSIFVSYSRADQKIAIPIIDALEKAGFSVWWDGLLAGGEKFADTTDDMLENAKAVVVLWSKNSVQSHWVHDEATRGRDRHCLVPLSIDGTEPPLGFRQFQVIDISRSYSRPASPAMMKLLDAVRGLHDVPISENYHFTPARAKIDRRLLLTGGAVATAAATGLVAWNMDWFGGSEVLGKLAILPFKNMGDDKSQDYFSDGLSEELRNTLATIKHLQIVAKASSEQFNDTDYNDKTIASKLKVQFLLRGSVRRVNDAIRVTVQLVDGKMGLDSWSGGFVRSTTDIFALQTDIAKAVAKALSIHTSAAMGLVRPGATKNRTAYEAYLRGTALYDLAVDENSDRAALAQFDGAVEADPQYAAAWAARARTLTTIANAYAKARELDVIYAEAIAAAKKATDLAPDLAAGHAALGYVLFNGRLDAKAAYDPYQKSYKYGSGSADILQNFATYMARIGNFEVAEKAINAAAKLDLLNPIAFRTKGRLYYIMGNFDAALADLNKAFKMNPKMNSVNADIGDIHYGRGQYHKALSFYQRDPWELLRLKGVAMVAHKLGNKNEAAAALENIRKDVGDSSLYQQAQILAQWGDRAAALAALEKARKIGDSGLVLARNDPQLAPLRNEPRYRALLRSIGFSVPNG